MHGCSSSSCREATAYVILLCFTKNASKPQEKPHNYTSNYHLPSCNNFFKWETASTGVIELGAECKQKTKVVHEQIKAQVNGKEIQILTGDIRFAIT